MSAATAVALEPSPAPGPGRHLDAHRHPDAGRYTRRMRVADLSRVEIAALPGVLLDLRRLFRPASHPGRAAAMTDLATRIRTTWPYPIARAYAALDDTQASPQLRQEALYFTVYQLMRTLGLALLGQYLSAPPAADPALRKDREAIAGAIARLRSPYFSDWLSLLRGLAKDGRWERLGLDFLPGFRAAMDASKADLLEVPRAYATRDGAGRLVQRLDLWSD